MSENERGIRRIGRTIYLCDEITNITVCEVMTMLQELEQEDKAKPIQLIINSEGGYIYDGFALYDKLRNSPCEIQAVGTGLIASMAVIIYLAADVRYLTDTARLMCHKASAMLGGNPDEIQIEAKEIDTLEKITNDITAERTGQSVRKIKSDIKAGNYYLSAEKAVEEGYAEKIIPNGPSKRPRRRVRRKRT